MNEDLSLPYMQLQVAAALREVKRCEATCEQFGLSLTEAQQRALVEARAQALAGSGRIEFGGGILPKLMEAFCDSPYVEKATWGETLADLQEAFYYYKGEAQERLSDDELIETMVSVFNGRAQGSTEYLTATSLEALCRYARQGWVPRDGEDAGDIF